MKFILKCLISFFLIFNFPVYTALMQEPIDATIQLSYSTSTTSSH
ncbi:hypothetical protein [Staphylococcus chromogenes]|uniref:Uncharacterized protein n=1 Tax=Staphylococcus chromogenes TaxID=46126 RepID=A0ABD5AXY2_STACR|nr:hypothetical protein [Staphylococcus chromogenes]MDQ7176165.1 hypothetical protein [Staphylococcus chromogenes]MDT0654335.1 hypothetical protein [Staphylococcus chromogenes]MDT0670714.1 hypothetical protein [Staphylococcus chromogenes]MDT0672906.1 hypothetical protein [Staphylococcus chromogenes]MDT0692638.1 hypothetical protein [Staphylococcus chromogenes]